MKNVTAGVCAALLCALLTGCSFGRGVLDVGHPAANLTVRKWLRSRRLTGSEGRWELPAGSYKTTSLRLTATDGNGESWVMYARPPLGELAGFTIRDQQTTLSPVGPPITLMVQPHRMRRQTVSISLSVVGQGGERYEPWALRSRRRSQAPKLKILDEAGTVLAQGAFKYG